MDQKEEDRATLTAVLKRFTRFRLPRALEIRERLNQGGTLTEMDMQFLDRVFEAAKDVMPIVERNPEYQPLAAQAVEIIHEITSLALEYEQVQSVKSRHEK